MTSTSSRQRNRNNYKFGVLDPTSPTRFSSKSLMTHFPIGINCTDSILQLLQRKPFLPPPVMPQNIQMLVDGVDGEPQGNQMDNEDLKELIEDEETEFDSLKNVLKQRYEKILNEEEEGDSPKKRRMSVRETIPYDEGDEHWSHYFFKFFKSNKVGTISPDEENNPVIEDNISLSSFERLKIEEEKEEIELQRLRSKYCSQSLGQFDIDDPFRRQAIYIMENKWFDRSVIFLIALNSLLLGLMDYTWKDDGKQTGIPVINLIAERSEILFTLFFTFECCVKILSMGLIVANESYLRDGWNWLDFLVVVTALLQSFVGNVSAIRTFRLFRPLRTLSAIPSMKILVNTLLNSVGQLGNILMLDAFFILTFAIFGLQMWAGITHFRCRQTPYPVDGDWLVVEDDNRICGGAHSCEIACGSLFETTLPDENGVLKEYPIDPSIPLDRDSFQPKFNYGITNFDSIFPSYLTIFQCTTLEGWSQIMIMIQNGYNIYISAFFFIFSVVLCSYFLLNLTVAVMLDKFKLLNQENTDRALFKYEINQRRVQELKEITNIMELKKKISFWNKVKYAYQLIIYENPGEPPRKGIENKRYDWAICRICWKIEHIPFFNTFVMLLIILNTIILATDKYPSPEIDLINKTNRAFNILFALECTIKLLSLKFKEWKQDPFNIFDFVIVLSSSLEMIMATIAANQSQGGAMGVISALRAFRLIRLIKLARSNHTLRCLLDSIAHTIVAIGNFMVILAIFIYVFALLGMQMFAGRLIFDEDMQFDPVNGKTSRENFDNLLSALITVFQILVGDNWNTVMYKAYLAVAPTAVIYFIIVVLIGKIILLNLFLAILLGNFEQESLQIRAQMEDAILKKFEHGQKIAQLKGLGQTNAGENSKSHQSVAKIGSGQSPEGFKLEPVPQFNKTPEQDKNTFLFPPLEIEEPIRLRLPSPNGNQNSIGFDKESQIIQKSFKDSSFDSSWNIPEQTSVKKQSPSPKGEFAQNYQPKLRKSISQKDKGLQLFEMAVNEDNLQADDVLPQQTVPLFKLEQITETPNKKILVDEPTPNRMTFGKKVDTPDDQEDMRNVDTHRQMLDKDKQDNTKKIVNKHTINLNDLQDLHLSDGEHSHSHKVVDSLGDEYVIDDQNESKSEWTLQQKVWDHMVNSSLLIIHRDSAFRQFMLNLTTAPITKQVTQKDILLSQIQNGGVQDDDTDDDEDFGQQCEDHNLMIKGGADLLPLGKPINLRKFMKLPDKCFHSHEAVSSPQNSQIKIPLSIPNELALTPSPLKSELPAESQVEKPGEDGTPTPQRPHIHDDSEESYNREITAIKEDSIKAKILRQSMLTRQMLRSYKSMKRKCFFINWTLNNWFENIIYIFIFCSMIMLMVDNPSLDPNSNVAIKIAFIDRIITIIFALEAICRIIAQGFFKCSIPQRKGYITSGSNKIDFFVTFGCDLIIIYNQSRGEGVSRAAMKSFKVLRALRALRPLRVISKNQGLKLAVGSLFGALPAIANGMIVCQLVVFIYAIIGVSLFKGKFYRCHYRNTSNDNFDADEIFADIIDEQDCIQSGGLWRNSKQNFDNIFQAQFVLYESITTEGWLDVMYKGIDSVDIGKQPKLNNNMMLSLYFISFIIIGNIFILNLFVGSVLDKFNRLKDRMCGYALMTRDQKEWVETEKQMIRLELEQKKSLPVNDNELIAYHVSSHRYFENFIMTCILCSTLIMALQYYKMPDQYLQVLIYVNYGLTLAYNIEALIKIVALQQQYFLSSWNRFDFFIVLAADIQIIIEFSMKDKDNQGIIIFLRILKAMRIMRVFRLIRASKNLRVLVDSLLVILPSIANVGSLIMLMFFIFSIIGMNMFSGVVHQKQITSDMNFSNFGMAFVLLIRCATGEKWNLIMRELAITQNDFQLYNYSNLGDDEEAFDCVYDQSFESLTKDGPRECGNSFSYFYFGLYILVIQMMMLNLFIAVVLEGFSSTNKEHTGAVTSEHFNELQELWVNYDQMATGWIDVKDLIFLIYQLSEPLGRKTEYEQEIKDQFDMPEVSEECIIDHNKRFVVHMDNNMIVPFKRALKLLVRINLPVYGEFAGDFKCHFRDVCKRLTRFALEQKNPGYDPTGVEYRHLKILSRSWVEKYPDLKTMKLRKGFDSGTLWASLFIASCLKNVNNLKKMKRQKLEVNSKNKNEIKPSNQRKQLKSHTGKSDQGSCNLSRNGSSRMAKLNKTYNKLNRLKSGQLKQETSLNPIVNCKHLQEEFNLNKNDVEIIKHCDFQIEKYKKEKEEQKISSEQRQMRDTKKKVDNVFKTLIINKMVVQPLENKLQKEILEVKVREQDKKDYERSTWWMDNDTTNAKMRNWVDKQDNKQ